MARGASLGGTWKTVANSAPADSDAPSNKQRTTPAGKQRSVRGARHANGGPFAAERRLAVLRILNMISPRASEGICYNKKAVTPARKTSAWVAIGR
jgi:hypothetical protein